MDVRKGEPLRVFRRLIGLGQAAKARSHQPAALHRATLVQGLFQGIQHEARVSAACTNRLLVGVDASGSVQVVGAIGSTLQIGLTP
ncbi:hypothetical protein [Methylobacterium currus]|jgi:hypothetical protein|uniref:hypothetical protein n=1 Tax=Methylobacterium currus TaxID=2051553 RepID=UPI0013DFCC9B